MKFKVFSTALIIGVFSIFVVGAAAQHEEHHADQQATESQAGMMGYNMMDKMKGNQQDMFRLMEKLMVNLKAIENEKNPAALKSELAEYQALLNQMHERMTQQGSMMSNMSDMMLNSSSMPCGGATSRMVPGIVRSISADSITLETVDSNRKMITVGLAPTTKFIKDGQDVTVKDLGVGDRAVVSLSAAGDKLEATQIVFGQLFQHMDMHHK